MVDVIVVHAVMDGWSLADKVTLTKRAQAMMFDKKGMLAEIANEARLVFTEKKMKTAAKYDDTFDRSNTSSDDKFDAPGYFESFSDVSGHTAGQ